MLYTRRAWRQTLKTSNWLYLLLLSAAVPAVAQDLPARIPFETVWEGISTHSPSLKAAESDAGASEAAASRAGAHWYPRLYLDARAYRSDDPATGFMSLLESREIESSDFSPASLNHPLETTYGQETVGIDWALYEGGARKAAAEAAGKMRDAKRLAASALRSGRYAETAGVYAALMTLEKEDRGLASVQDSVLEMLKTYSIGSKSNPVGYSGLLGLKTLANRLEGLRAAVSAQRAALKGGLSLEAGDLPKEWEPQQLDLMPFLDRVLPRNKEAVDPQSVRAAEAGAEAMEKMKGTETARFLPRVALFGEGGLHQGDRAVAHAYTAGAYLQWNLFDATSLKAREEADRKAQAEKERAEAMRTQADADRLRAGESLKALAGNLALMDDSSRLLEEQTRTARMLFRNGSINALQMVEVFARRVDLVEQQARAGVEYAQARALEAVQSGFEEASHDAR